MSRDDIPTLARFQHDLAAPQRFVSDAAGSIAKAYGTAYPGLPTYDDRITLVVGRRGDILHAVRDESPLSNVNATYDWLKAHPQTQAHP